VVFYFPAAKHQFKEIVNTVATVIRGEEDVTALQDFAVCLMPVIILFISGRKILDA